MGNNAITWLTIVLISPLKRVIGIQNFLNLLVQVEIIFIFNSNLCLAKMTVIMFCSHLDWHSSLK